MKIDRTKLKKSSSEVRVGVMAGAGVTAVLQVPADCRALIEELKGCSQGDFLAKLRGIETWTYGGTKGVVG